MMDVETFLEHHGVKGQKWGVRHDPGHVGERVKTKHLGKLDQAWFNKIDKPKGWDAVAVHNRVADKVNANIDAFNKKPQYKNANLIKSPNSPITKKYMRDFEAMQAKYFKEAVKEIHGVSPSGSMRTEVVNTPQGYVIKVHGAHTWADVSHAEDSSNDLLFHLTLDSDGHINGIQSLEKSVAQSDLSIDFLDHHGIKGMHWGIRNKNKGSKSSKGRVGLTTFDKHPHRLTDSELTRRIKRLEMEKRYKDLNAPVKTKGKEYAHSLLESSGRTVVGAAVGGAAGFFIQKALREKFG